MGSADDEPGNQGGVGMKIKVDFDLCESNAMCEALAPDVFELYDYDFLQLIIRYAVTGPTVQHFKCNCGKEARIPKQSDIDSRNCRRYI
jgi:ferredoxin